MRSIPVVLFGVLVLAGASHGDTSPPYDLVIRGGTLYLGGDTMGGTGDVALVGDRIVAVGEAPGRARREIDARGRIVAPGFIDLHTHTDEVYRRLGWLPVPDSVHSNRNYQSQGVTTIVTGNCGSGFADPEAILDWLRRVDQLPYGSNVIHLIPHGQLRLEAMGEAQAERASPAPTPDELEAMEHRVDAGMRTGAWGISTGLAYDPGARSELAEIVALARIAARHGGVYASHTRHEGPDPERMLASYAEAIAIGERAGLPVHISHIKLSGAAVHGMTESVIELVESARARGVRVTADQYPYAASSTTLASLAPVEMRDGMAVIDRYCEGERRELRSAVGRVLATGPSPEGVQVSVYPWRWWWQGKRVSTIAQERGVPPVEVAMDLACGWPGLGIYHAQDETDVRSFMQQEWVATASDGAVEIPLVGRFIHPRAYGTFPRKIRYALDEQVISLPQALRSMTELPAQAFDIPERGRLEPGHFADIVVFDPESLRDRSTYERSAIPSEGVEVLVVNGVLSILDGEHTSERGGRALRRTSR